MLRDPESAGVVPQWPRTCSEAVPDNAEGDIRQQLWCEDAAGARTWRQSWLSRRPRRSLGSAWKPGASARTASEKRSSAAAAALASSRWLRTSAASARIWNAFEGANASSSARMHALSARPACVPHALL